MTFFFLLYVLPADVFHLFHFSPVSLYPLLPRMPVKWKKVGQISKVNAHLTFWTTMTNGKHIWGVFVSFQRVRDVVDSEVHFQGPK